CWTNCCTSNCTALYPDKGVDTQACITDCMNNAVPSGCQSGAPSANWCANTTDPYSCFLNILDNTKCISGSQPCLDTFFCRYCTCKNGLDENNNRKCWCQP